MKRLGVRLAAGAAVILLGVLAVAQAQRDRQSEPRPDWDLEQPSGPVGPPVPIAALEGGGAAAPLSADAAAFAAPAFGGDDAAARPGTTAYQLPGAEPVIQLAAHQESPSQGPADAPGMAFVPDPGFAPGMPTTAPADPSYAAGAPAAQEAGGMHYEAAPPSYDVAPSPDARSPDAQSPAASLQMPQATDADTMPSFAFPAGPAVDLSFDTPAAADPATAATIAEAGAADGPAAGEDRAAAGDPAAAPNVGSSPDMNGAPAMMAVPASVADTDGGYDAAPDAFGPAAITGNPRTASENVLRAETPADAAPSADTHNRSADAAHAEPATGAAALDASQQPAALPQTPSYAQQPGGMNADISSHSAGESPSPAASFAAPGAAAEPAARIASADLGALRLEQLLTQPGERRLEGAQAPSIVIHKRAPEEVNVGKPATFVIQLQNVGTAEALDVQIHDVIPEGMRLIDAAPQPQRQGDLLVWSLGSVEPGGERSVTMQLVPEVEGELGSVARVTFEAAASVRTVSTRPELRVQQRAPEKVLIGQQLEIEIEVSNTGSGSAANVMLQADIPEGLEHPKGRQLDNLIGTLGPGQSRTQVLRLRAVKPGVTESVVRLGAEDGLTAEHQVKVEVVAPQLEVVLEGPTRRFLERQAVYNVSIANVGTATASNVELVAYLDRGFSFVGTEFEGQYDASQHAVYWSLAELPAGQQGLVPLTLLPVEAGEQAVRLEAMADLATQVKHEKRVSVDTRAELSFAVADVNDPIETGSETTYEIRVSNSGSRGDTNVQLQVQLPPALQLVSADAPAGTDGKGMIAFEPVKELSAGQDQVYRIRVAGAQPGTHLIRAVLSSDQSTVPVTKEESTTVYADN